MKNEIFLQVNLTGFDRPGLEIANFFSEIGLEVAFLTSLQYRIPQMPNSACFSSLRISI